MIKMETLIALLSITLYRNILRGAGNPELRKKHNPAYASKLYRNDNGHFTDVTEAAGITSNVLTFGLGLAVSDLNNDGWPDVVCIKRF